MLNYMIYQKMYELKFQGNYLVEGSPLTSENIAKEYLDKGRPKNTDAYKNAIKVEMMRGY